MFGKHDIEFNENELVPSKKFMVAEEKKVIHHRADLM